MYGVTWISEDLRGAAQHEEGEGGEVGVAFFALERELNAMRCMPGGVLLLWLGGVGLCIAGRRTVKRPRLANARQSGSPQNPARPLSRLGTAARGGAPGQEPSPRWQEAPHQARHQVGAGWVAWGLGRCVQAAPLALQPGAAVATSNAGITLPHFVAPPHLDLTCGKCVYRIDRLPHFPAPKVQQPNGRRLLLPAGVQHLLAPRPATGPRGRAHCCRVQSVRRGGRGGKVGVTRLG